MSKINLRDYYPFYTSDCFIEVSDELAVFLEGCDKAENAYQRKAGKADLRSLLYGYK